MEGFLLLENLRCSHCHLLPSYGLHYCFLPGVYLVCYFNHISYDVALYE